MKLKITFLFTLMCALMVNFSFAQEKLVSGVVRDAQGVIPGVNVVVKGTARSVQTNDKGKFAINVKVGEVLQFSFIGMETKEVTVGASSEIKVTLSDAATALKDVVVNVGYQSVKKGNVTGSVSVVGSKEIENRPVASFDQILQGSAPGLVVQAGSGQPGAAASVNIRGTHSINGSSTPLYIMDGVPITAGDFAALNPNDFDNVSVLKDAASTSIYGTRGTNGVILITSKKGKFKSATNFTFKTQYGVSEIGPNRVTMMNAEQKMIYENKVFPGKYSETDLAFARGNSTNWEKYFFRQGVTKTYELGASGGSENTRFYTSLSYYDQEGIALRSDLKRFTYRINLDNKASDKVRLGTNVQLGLTKNTSTGNEGALSTGNPFLAAYMSSPLTTPYNPDGSLNTGATVTDPVIGTYNKIGANNMENLLYNLRNSMNFKMVGNAFAEVNILKDLTFRSEVGMDYTTTRSEQAYNPNTFFGRTVQPGLAGFYSQGNSFLANLTMTQRLKYDRTFSEKHNISVMALSEYVKNYSKSGGFTGFGLNEKMWQFPGGITPGSASNNLIPTVSGGDSELGLFSYFVNARYGYDNRYNFDATVRRDASSRFSKANKWATFFALGANWNVSAEKFMQKYTAINDLRLRASYGTTGNQSGISPFNDENTWVTTSYAGLGGLTPGTMANPELVWEKSNKFNVGIDYGFYNNRFSGTLDFYRELTTDLFIQQSLAAAALNSSLNVNAGSMSNTGVDLSLKAYVVRGKSQDDFAWSLSGNANYNRNNIEDLGQVSEYEAGTSIVRVGLPFGSHYIQGWAGVNPANGQPLYLDKNGNVTTVYSTDNYVANFGTFKPVYTGGFGTEVSYKGFTLNALFTFAAEYSRFNNQSFFMENSSASWFQYNQTTNMLNIWTKPGDVTDIQGAAYDREFSSKDIEDASYTRLRNVTLSYNLPKSLLENNKFFSSVRIYTQAQNLYTWTNYSGYDPEDDNNIGTYEYPTPRTVTLGLDLKF